MIRSRSDLIRRILALLATLVIGSWFVSLLYLVQLHRLHSITFVESYGPDYIINENGVNVTKNKSTQDRFISGQESASDPFKSTSESIHVVTSTDCSGYQHWQSIALYYSLRRSGHLGPFTRIVSGCSADQEESIRKEFQKINDSEQRRKYDGENGSKISKYSINSGGENGPRLRLHFTPSFVLKGKHYKYSNKPGGLSHWVNHTFASFNDSAKSVSEPNSREETIIALIDPDMMMLRPFISILGEQLKPRDLSGVTEYVDDKGRVQHLRQSKLPTLPPRISKGVAAGQHFGIGGLWASAGMSDARKDFKSFNLTAVCGTDSPCLNAPNEQSQNKYYTTRKMADEYYSVGPIYLATVPDWQILLPKWHAFTPRVHSQYPKLLAEMYAFTMAAADVRLKFALASSFMVSDPKTMSSTEAWRWIDGYGDLHDQVNTASDRENEAMWSVCSGATHNSIPTETLRRLEHYGYGHYPGGNGIVGSEGDGGGPLPTTLHFCQNYNFANHTFAKRKMPHDFFRCDGTPLKFDLDEIKKELLFLDNGDGGSDSQKKIRKRSAFMICHLIPLMNLALEEYQADVCS